MLEIMNPNVRNSLIKTKDIIEAEILSLHSQLSTVIALINGDCVKIAQTGMVKGDKRRRGGMEQVKQCLTVLQSGTNRQIALKMMELFPVEGETQTISKVSTYLKRLHDAGDIQCNGAKRKKIYSINTQSK